MPTATISVPMWVIYVVSAYMVLSCIANAMSLSDRSFYGFVFRFLRLLTYSAGKELEQLHIPVPQIPTQDPTQADATTPSAQAPSGQ